MLRVGIVGASRTRQGLGPYLATAFEAAGCAVTAVAGRDSTSAERAAAALTTRLGHAVVAADDAAALARTVDVLVVAAPVPGHLAGLDAALAAGVPCLCEKPLVAAADATAGLARVQSFRERGLLLVENCQWPFVLPALHELHAQLRGRTPRSVAMGLSPVGMGRAMLEDSLSHVLSVVQELVPLPPSATPQWVRQSDASPLAERNDVRFTLSARSGSIDVSIHLTRCPEPPRPAWLAIDGVRVDRRIGADYAQSLVAAGGRAVLVRDPLHQLVEHFTTAVRQPDREQRARLADAIALRLRLYADVLTARPA